MRNNGKVFRKVYGTSPTEATALFSEIDRAIQERKPFSLIRAGDMVTLILTKKSHLIRVDAFRFLGIPNPPPAELITELHQAIANADTLGVSTFKGRTRIAVQLKDYLDKHGIRPRFLTWPFIGDTLYERGLLRQLIEKNRVVYVGRQAPIAARRNKGEGFTLDSWRELDDVEGKLGTDWDLALVGAGIPGRILCNRLKQKGKVALDIGHIMDALAYPTVWEQSDPAYRRRAFKNAFLENRKPRPMLKPSSSKRKRVPNGIVVFVGTVLRGMGTATNIMEQRKVREQLFRITKKKIMAGTLNLRLKAGLKIKNGKKWQYGTLCPARLNGVPVFVNKRSFFRKNFVTIISDVYLRGRLGIQTNERVYLEIDNRYVN